MAARWQHTLLLDSRLCTELNRSNVMRFTLPKPLRNCRSVRLKFATLPRIDSSPYVLLRLRLNGQPVGRVQLPTPGLQTRRPGGGTMPDVQRELPEPFFAALPLTTVTATKPTAELQMGRLGEFVYELLDGMRLEYTRVDEGTIGYALDLPNVPVLHQLELELCHPPTLAGNALVMPDYNLVLHIATLDVDDVESLLDPNPEDDQERTRGPVVSVNGHPAFVVDHNANRIALASIRQGYTPKQGDAVVASTTLKTAHIRTVVTSEPAAVVALSVEADAC